MFCYVLNTLISYAVKFGKENSKLRVILTYLIKMHASLSEKLPFYPFYFCFRI